MKELEGYREPLQKLLAKLRVTAQADKKYAMFQPELTKSVQDLGAFIDKSLDTIWQFEALPIEKVPGTWCCMGVMSCAHACICLHPWLCT